MSAERPAWKVREINHMVRMRFGHVFSSNVGYRNNVTVRYAKSYISDIPDMASLVARNYFDTSAETLHRFLRAIELGQAMSAVNNEGKIYFDLMLQLNRLTPGFLGSHNLTRTADSVLRTGDCVARFRFLYGIGAFWIRTEHPARKARHKVPGPQTELPFYAMMPMPYGLFFPNNDQLVYKFKLIKQGKREVRLGYIGPDAGGPELIS